LRYHHGKIRGGEGATGHLITLSGRRATANGYTESTWSMFFLQLQRNANLQTSPLQYFRITEPQVVKEGLETIASSQSEGITCYNPCCALRNEQYVRNSTVSQQCNICSCIGKQNVE